MPSKSKIFKYFLIFFIGGVSIGSFLQPKSFVIWTILVLAIAFLAVDFRGRKNIFLFFCALGFALGMARINAETQKIYERPQSEFRGYARVAKEPQRKEEYAQLILEDIGTKNRFLANVSLYPRYERGDLLGVQCDLANPENKYPKFDYIRYLAKDGIYQICRKASLEKLEKNNDGSKKNVGQAELLEKSRAYYFSKIFSIKKSLEGRINRIFPSPESEYLTGLLLGGSERLPEQVAENFRRTGTTHTVAVSGYNITILAEFLMFAGILAGLWRPKAFWLAVIGVVFFVMMIGSPASAVRAAIMGVLLLWAAKMGRLSNSVVAILLAGSIMVALSPLILFHDVGFQLSFLATLGIVLIYGPLSEKFEIKKDFLELKSIFLVSISAQLGVLGVMLYTFETFSPVSLLANLLILPAVPFIMFGGFFVSILSYVSLPLAKLFSIPVWLGLHLEIKITQYMAGFSWSLVGIEGLGWLFVILYYLFFTLLVVKLRKSKGELLNA